MRNLIIRTMLVIASIAVTAVLFQNCSENFNVTEGLENGSTNLGSHANHQAPHINPVSTKLEPNTDLEFTVHSEALLPSTSFEWSHSLNAAVSACTVKNGNKSTNYIINCAQAGSLVVNVKAMEGNIPVDVPAYSLTLNTPPVSTGEINLMVNFNIPAGTASSPWNTTSTVVETFVGQTLKITNQDSVTHQMHTNGKPCSHGSAMAPGTSTNCVISKAYDYKTDGALYDHDLGTKSAFYMVAYDGAALYATNCASCHNPLATSTKKGARVSQIKNALSNVSQMKAENNLQLLTQRQIEAISFALGAK